MFSIGEISENLTGIIWCRFHGQGRNDGQGDSKSNHQNPYNRWFGTITDVCVLLNIWVERSPSRGISGMKKPTECWNLCVKKRKTSLMKRLKI
jgi:hypothetical protein